MVWLGRRKWHLHVRRGTQFYEIRGHGSAAVHVESRPPSLHHLPPGPDGRTDLLHPHQGRQQGGTTDCPGKMFTLSHLDIKAVNRAGKQTVQVRCLLCLTWTHQGRKQGSTTYCPGKMFTLSHMVTSRKDNRLSR